MMRSSGRALVAGAWVPGAVWSVRGGRSRTLAAVPVTPGRRGPSPKKPHRPSPSASSLRSPRSTSSPSLSARHSASSSSSSKSADGKKVPCSSSSSSSSPRHSAQASRTHPTNHKKSSHHSTATSSKKSNYKRPRRNSTPSSLLLREQLVDRSPKIPAALMPDRVSLQVRPPALLLPTASPHVYVAKQAVMDLQMDFRQLFAHVVAGQSSPSSSSSSSKAPTATTATHNPTEVESDPIHLGTIENVASNASTTLTTTFRRPVPRVASSSTTTTTSSTSTQRPSSWSLSGGQFEYFSPQQMNYEPPVGTIPEVAFLGRSNVGKSSLMNALMQRNLALTSKQPGRTQQAMYYGWVSHQQQQQQATASSSSSSSRSPNQVKGFLIDLPGYGYAVGPDQVVQDWQTRAQDFLLQRRDAGNLHRLFLLVDARVGAQPFDLSVQGWFDEAEIPYTVVLTKADAVRPADVVKQANQICLRYHHQASERAEYQRSLRNDDDEEEEEDDDDDDMPIWMSPLVHVTSARAGTGIAELMSSIATEFSVARNTDEVDSLRNLP